MRENGLLSVIRKKKRWYGKKVKEPKENLLNRNFESRKPTQKLATDITEIKIFSKKLYLSSVIDLFNNEIVSFKIGKRNNLELVKQTIDNLLMKNKNGIKGSIFHSDQGFQYTHKSIKNKLNENSIKQSMSRKGNPLDNAVIENFFGIMKSELIYNELTKFDSVDHFIDELKRWITYYNNERIQEKLGYKSPVKYKKAILTC